MRVSIIVDDKTAYIDGQVREGVDMSGVPGDVHAVQWYGDYGEIEYKTRLVGAKLVKPENTMITVLPDYVAALVGG